MTDTYVPRGVFVAGVILWGMVFVLGAALALPHAVGAISGVAAAGDAPQHGNGTAGNGTAGNGTAVYATDNGSMAVDENGSIDLGVDVGSFEVALETGGIGDDWAAISMQSPAIDEGVERDGNAGLCMIGLDSSQGPVDIAIDGERGRVDSNVTASPGEGGPDAPSDPQAVLEACRTR